MIRRQILEENFIAVQPKILDITRTHQQTLDWLKANDFFLKEDTIRQCHRDLGISCRAIGKVYSKVRRGIYEFVIERLQGGPERGEMFQRYIDTL